MVEFAARRGETYEIVVRRWSGTDAVWFGLAWTVNGVSLVGERVSQQAHPAVWP